MKSTTGNEGESGRTKGERLSERDLIALYNLSLIHI